MKPSARLLAACCIAALGGSCKPADALLQLDLTAERSYSNVQVALSANEGPAHLYTGATLSPVEAFRTGLYVPGDMRGTVNVVATVHDMATGACLGGGMATIFDVSPGRVMAAQPLLVSSTDGPCPTLPAGNGGDPGTGGVVGTGGVTSTGGVAATGGIGGTGAVIGTGGVVATGGVTSTGGVTATGGTTASGGAPGTGGAVGSGGAGGCGTLVDDMEDGDGLICVGSGRSGHWFTYVDSGGSITPPPSDTVPASPTLLSPARGSSQFGMHASGMYAGYAGLGCLLNNPVIGETAKTYDALAANYTGVHFFAKSDAGLYFAIQTSATISTMYGGTCTMATCYGASYTVPTGQLSATTWQEFNIPFSQLTPGVAAFRASDIWNIAFQPAATGAFNLWIDDVGFF